jgi:hypothetical protein
MARSMSPDSGVDRSTFCRIRSDVAATIRRAQSLQEKAVNQLHVFLTTELGMGMAQARIASRSGNRKDASRHTAIARQAYDSIIRLNQRMTRGQLQSDEFTAELDRLKVALRNLGENV